MFQAVIESPDKFIINLINSDNIKSVSSICTIKRNKKDTYYLIVNEMTDVIGSFIKNEGYIKGEITYKNNKYLFRSSRYKELIVLNDVSDKVHPFSRGIKLSYKDNNKSKSLLKVNATLRQSSYNKLNNFNLINSLVKKQSKEGFKKGYVFVKYVQQAKFFCKDDVVYMQNVLSYDDNWIDKTVKSLQDLPKWKTTK